MEAGPRRLSPTHPPRTGCSRCLVFLHTWKAGGTTLLRVLGADQPRTRCGGLYYCNWYAFNETGCRSAASARADLIGWIAERQDFRRARLYYGGYAASLMGLSNGPARSRGCVRLAIFREPVSLLASAIAYCEAGYRNDAPTKRAGGPDGDQLCGGMSNGSVVSWARHLGPMQFSQLLLHPAVSGSRLSRAAAAPSGAAAAGAAALNSDGGSHGPAGSSTASAVAVWQHTRRELLGGGRFEKGALLRIERGLADGSLVDVVGIYEEWRATMGLLDQLLPLPPPASWAMKAAELTDTHGSDAWRARKEEIAAQARSSAEVATVLAPDARVYRAAAARFAALRAGLGRTRRAGS